MEGQEAGPDRSMNGATGDSSESGRASQAAGICIVRQAAPRSRLPAPPGATQQVIARSPILNKSPTPKPHHAAYTQSPTRSDTASKESQVSTTKPRADAQSRQVGKRVVGQVKSSPQKDLQPKPPEGKPRPVVPKINLGKLLIPVPAAAGPLMSAGSSATPNGTGHRYSDQASMQQTSAGSRAGMRHEFEHMKPISPALHSQSPTRSRNAKVNRSTQATRTSANQLMPSEAQPGRPVPRSAERSFVAALRVSKPMGYAAGLASPAKQSTYAAALPSPAKQPTYVAAVPSPAKCQSPVSKHAPVLTNSPSPTAPRSKSRLRCSLEVMPSARMVHVEEPVRRSGSVERSKAAPVVQHRETRASILRRSSSVDRRQSVGHAHTPSAVKRPAANPALHTAYAGIIRPTPPAEGRDAQHAAARLRTTAATGTATRVSTVASRASGQGLLQRTSDSSVLSKLSRGAGGRSAAAAGRASHAGSVAAAAAAADQAGAGHKQPMGKMASSILAAIPERLKQQSTTNMAASMSKPTAALAVPKLRLNLAAVKRLPEPDVNTVVSDPRSEHQMPAIPKLNLTPVMEQQAAEQDVGDQYVMTPEELANIKTAQINLPKKSSGKSGSSKKGGPPSPPPDHFYFYPKLDPDAERRTLDLLARMPKSEQKHWRKIFNDSIQAKQNCEAIAFRGHRLLDQMNSHHKEREVEVTSKLQQYKSMYEEAKQYKDMYQTLVQMLNPEQMMALQLQSMQLGGSREAAPHDQMSSGSGSNMASPVPMFHTPQPDFQVPLFEVPPDMPMMRMSGRDSAGRNLNLFNTSGRLGELHSTHTFGTQPQAVAAHAAAINPASVRITSDTYQLARDNIQAAVSSTSIGGWAPAGRLADMEERGSVDGDGEGCMDAHEPVDVGRDQEEVAGYVEQLTKDLYSGGVQRYSRDVQPELDVLRGLHRD